MNRVQQDIDKITKDLLKKSLLKPSTNDFDDVLMDKIQHAPFPVRQESIAKPIDRGWLLLLFAVICFISSILIVGNYVGIYMSDTSGLFSNIANYIMYGGMALFIPLVLYQFDSLMRTFFLRRNKNISLS